MTQTDIEITLLAITTVLGLYLSFFKSYFEERGKIVATKKDIEDITAKIETVKSEVGILTHRKISLSTEKQNSLLDYYAKYSSWMHYILNLSILPDNDSPDLYVERSMAKLHSLYHDYLLAEAKMYVFFNDDTALIELESELMLKTLEMSSHLSISMIEGRTVTKKLNLAFDSPLIDKLIVIEQLGEESRNIQEIFMNERLAKHVTIAPLNVKMAKLVSKRIHDFELK